MKCECCGRRIRKKWSPTRVAYAEGFAVGAVLVLWIVGTIFAFSLGSS